MKNKLFIAFIAFAFSACETILPSPESDFDIKVYAEGDVTMIEPSGKFNSIIVDWGDGNSNNYKTPYSGINHTYNADGSYTVKVTTKNGIGKTSSSSQVVNINTTMARFMVYVAKDFKDNSMLYYLDGRLIGQSLGQYSLNPNYRCGDEAAIKQVGVVVSVKPGKHRLTAETFPNKKSSWTHDFSISNKGCFALSLN